MRTSLLLCAAAALGFPLAASAQLQRTTAEVVARAFANSDVVPITDALLVQVRAAVRMEITLRRQFQQELARYRKPDQYRMCADEAAMSPEGMKIAMLMADLPPSATAADMERAAEKMNAALGALVKKNCGGDIREDWPDNKRKERVDAIEARAAASVALGADWPAASLPAGPAPREAVSSRAIPIIQYRIIKERYIAWCASIGPAAIGRIRELSADEWDLAAPGAGQGIYWVFMKNEITAFGDSCDEWLELMHEYDGFEW